MLRTGLVASVSGGVYVYLFQPLGGVNQSAQVHIWVAVLGRPHDALRTTSAGEPDIGPRALHGLDPRIYDSVLEILTLVPEGAVIGPAFDNQVVGFLKPREVLGGVLSR